MAKGVNQKLKLLYIAKYFMENTDEEHFVTVPEIISYLNSNDISAERKAVYDDIECLKLFGLDICCEKAKTFNYYLASREFETPELKLLVDAVQASKFITVKKSFALIKKIETLTSKAGAGLLNREVYVANRAKTENEHIYYNVDKIHEAILKNRQICFKYYEWGTDKKKHFRKDGEFYKEAPVALTYSDENYYLITYKEKYNSYVHYRVDKMEQTSIAEEERVLPKEQFDLPIYVKKTFSMYRGEEKSVTVEFDNSLVGVVIDRFGSNVTIVPSENTFTAHLNVAVSPYFYSWLVGFGNKAKILSPENVKADFLNHIEEIRKIY